MELFKTSISLSKRSRMLLENLACEWGESLSAAVERCIQVAEMAEKQRRREVAAVAQAIRKTKTRSGKHGTITKGNK